MAKTMVATHIENHPTWQRWSEAAAAAENTPHGPQLESAWAHADRLWREWQAELVILLDYDMTMDAASNRAGY